MPALRAWISSPKARDTDDDGCVRQLNDFQFVLAHPHGLDQDLLKTHGLQNHRRLMGLPRESPEPASRRHGADEDTGIRRVLLHTDPIAQDRPATEGA